MHLQDLPLAMSLRRPRVLPARNGLTEPAQETSP